MIVVSDASVLINLAWLGKLHLGMGILLNRKLVIPAKAGIHAC